MAATNSTVSLAEYLHSDYEPDAEYVDGAIEERPMGEDDHASWQEALLRWFHRHADVWQVRARPGLRVQVSPTRFRVPDVTVLDRRQPKEQIVTRPPLAVFEILSPENQVRRMLAKLGDYEAMGIRQIWVVDPDGPRFYRYEAGALQPSAEFGAPGEPVHFALAEVARLRD